jgi:hypothetical protein
LLYDYALTDDDASKKQLSWFLTLMSSGASSP